MESSGAFCSRNRFERIIIPRSRVRLENKIRNEFIGAIIIIYEPRAGTALFYFSKAPAAISIRRTLYYIILWR